MQAKIKTKSNYRGLNYHWLKVDQIQGTRITCFYFAPEFQQVISVDFTIKEILEFKNN